MRIFVALEIPTGIRERIGEFLEEVRQSAPAARWVRPESLHVTLKFIGEKPAADVERIRQALADIKGEYCFNVTFSGCGFFPTAKTARVFWVGVEDNPRLAGLAKLVDERLNQAGVPPEEREFSPHLTLARAGSSGAPHRVREDRKNRAFDKLHEKLATLGALEFGTMAAREFILYQSRLSSAGAQYTCLARFALGQS